MSKRSLLGVPCSVSRAAPFYLLVVLLSGCGGNDASQPQYSFPCYGLDHAISQNTACCNNGVAKDPPPAGCPKDNGSLSSIQDAAANSTYSASKSLRSAFDLSGLQPPSNLAPTTQAATDDLRRPASVNLTDPSSGSISGHTGGTDGSLPFSGLLDFSGLKNQSSPSGGTGNSTAKGSGAPLLPGAETAAIGNPAGSSAPWSTFSNPGGEDVYRPGDTSASSRNGGLGTGLGGSGFGGGSAFGNTAADSLSGSLAESLNFGRNLASEVPPIVSMDPEDYFSRLSTSVSIFKVVERRYKQTSLSWTSEKLQELSARRNPAKK